MEHSQLSKKILGKDKKLRGQIQNLEASKSLAQRQFRSVNLFINEQPGFLEEEEGEERLRLRQQDLKPLVPVKNVNNIFDLKLNFGDYFIDYTRDGNSLLMAGKLGHISMMKWKEKKLVTEFNVKDKIRDVKFLQNDSLFAVAQEKYVYIYDSNGIEVHRLKSHPEPCKLEYLPYHYLLVSIGKLGVFNYQDVSTGATVAQFKTNIKDARAMAHNPTNAIVGVGSHRGDVTLWSPNTGVPLVRMLCHKGIVESLAFHPSGNYMTTIGSEGAFKVWDVRTYKELYDYFTPRPATVCDISQTGLLALAYGNEVQIWKDYYQAKAKRPYFKHTFENDRVVNDLKFAPFEDFLGIGLHGGFSSVLVPGSGEPNFDSFEVDVFQRKRQRKEAEVHKLLEKLPPETITLNPEIIGTVDRASADVLAKERKEEEEEAERKRLLQKKKKNRMRGRDTATGQEKRKESVHDAKTRLRLKEKLEMKTRLRKAERNKVSEETNLLESGDVIDNIDVFDVVRKRHKSN
eukprot:TRINITY_DN9288_c0_g1_i3.p1 TRINITY_DN9288_c0_g1~~TRINITY_DN9288_c0_g1_i3.p1  ORF type:complete len:516 (-),score=142.12 TRINITY_DN9288_c0_g1_i3:100-1647(-)